MTRSDRAWQQWGRRDPYYAVYSDKRFRSEELDSSARSAFFQSGAEHFNSVLSNIRLHLDPEFHPSSALDFGCGVGRVLVPLARCCRRVVGVDVSDGMLEEARRNMEALRITNVELIASDDQLSRVTGTFDLIHSFIVFQHIPVRRGMSILHKLFTHLNDGGAAIVQVVYRRTPPLNALRRAFKVLSQHSGLVNRAVNIARGFPPADPPMQMNLYDVNELLALFHEDGLDNVHLMLRHGMGYASVELYGQKAGRLITPSTREFERPSLDKIPVPAQPGGPHIVPGS